MNPSVLRFCLLVAVVMTVGPLHAQTHSARIVVTGKAPPSVQEIVQRAVANDELRREHRLALECDQLLTTERLDEAGTVFKTKTAHVLYRGDQEAAHANPELPPEELPEHHRDGDTVKAEHRLAVLNLRLLAPRFDCKLVEEAPVRGRACYVVEYSPRSGEPAATREEKVINGLHGRFWIDKGTFEILQGEGSLVRPVSVAILGSVTRLDFAVQTQTLPNGEVGPADFSTDLVIKAPFHFYRQRQTSRLENWRPRA